MQFRLWFESQQHYDATYKKKTERAAKSNPKAFQSWFPEGQNRIFVPITINGSEIPEQKQIYQEFESYLSDKGYRISDWTAGLCQSEEDIEKGKNNRQYRIGAVLQKIAPNNPLARTMLEKFNKLDIKLSPQENQCQMMISQDPHDLVKMSYDKRWEAESCMRLPDPKKPLNVTKKWAQLFKQELPAGGLVAYLLKPNSQNINDALARIWIRRFETKSNKNYALCEQKIYGFQSLNFLKKLEEWIASKQEEPVGTLYRQGATWSDTWRKSTGWDVSDSSIRKIEKYPSDPAKLNNLVIKLAKKEKLNVISRIIEDNKLDDEVLIKVLSSVKTKEPILTKLAPYIAASINLSKYRGQPGYQIASEELVKVWGKFAVQIDGTTELNKGESYGTPGKTWNNELYSTLEFAIHDGIIKPSENLPWRVSLQFVKKYPKLLENTWNKFFENFQQDLEVLGEGWDIAEHLNDIPDNKKYVEQFIKLGIKLLSQNLDEEFSDTYNKIVPIHFLKIVDYYREDPPYFPEIENVFLASMVNFRDREWADIPFVFKNAPLETIREIMRKIQHLSERYGNVTMGRAFFTGLNVFKMIWRRRNKDLFPAG